MLAPKNHSGIIQKIPAFAAKVFEWSRHYYRNNRLAILGLSVIGLTAFFARYLALARYSAPPGADYGNYLTNLHAFLGNDVTGQGVQYPAVFLLYLWSVVSVFGELHGLQVSGPLLGAVLCVPAYALLRNYVETPFALVGAALITFAEGVSEMIGWGGNPNLLGMIFGMFFLAFALRFMEAGRRPDLLLAGASFGLLAGSHQISLAFFGLAFVLGMLVLVAKSRKREQLRRGIYALVAGLIASALFVPFYLNFAQQGSAILPARPILLTLDDLIFVTTWLFREALAIWILLAIVAIFGYRLLGSSNRIGFAFGVALMASPFLLAATVMVLHPVRPLYFVPLGIVPGAMVFVQHRLRGIEIRHESRRSRVDPAIMATALVLALTLVLVSSAHRRATDATDWYMVMSDDVRQGLEWISENTPEGSVVATSGPARFGEERLVGCTWGWWVEGYAKRRSFCTADPNAMAWSPQVRLASEANKAFAGVVSVENGWLRVGDYSPYGSRGNPIISGDFGFGYETLVYFSDPRVVIEWRPNGSMSNRAESPFFLADRTATQVATLDQSRFENLARGDGILVRRMVEVARSSSMVWVNYSVSVAGTIEQAKISVFGTATSRLNNFDYDSRTLVVGGVPGFRERVGGSVRILRGAEFLDPTATAFMTNPDSEMPEVRFAFSPAGNLFDVTFAVNAFYDSTAVPSEIRLFNAESIFVAEGVDFVLVDKRKIRDMEWFTGDSSHFKIAYQNYGVMLFEVV